MQFLNNPDKIIISCNYVPSFHYKCVLLITYNPDNISKKLLHVHGFLYFGLCLVWFRVRFYLTSALCLMSSVTPWFTPHVNIRYNRAV